MTTTAPSGPTHRSAALAVGLLLIAGVVSSLAATAVLGTALTTDDVLAGVAANRAGVVAGVVLQLATALGAVGIALGLYPVLRTHSPGPALAAVALRTIEAVFSALGALMLLALLAAADARVGLDPSPTATIVPAAIVAVRDAANYVIGVLCFGGAALIYYAVLHRARLLPGLLTVWGLIGVVIISATAVLTLLDGAPYRIDGPIALLAAPIALQELVLGGWLLLRGFRSAPA